ncbi:MAG: methylenetetrahydrofolate reductase, partial [Oscillospiraceae bacterium]|nr:methylenetetrahydrofolate reductase [Oscillospiraceae bacterium]
MMINKLFEQKKAVMSFEIFPPKKDANIETVFDTLSALRDLSPDFISITYGAGGSIAENRTVQLCDLVKNKYGIIPVAHLTCINSTKDEVLDVLAQLKEKGVKNILALRGDRIPDVPPKTDFKYAYELIDFIKQNGNFNISAACYPESHPECDSMKDNINHLKMKVDAGANHLITQLFFDNEDFYKFQELADIKDIDAPIDAGIMPVINKKQIERIVSLSGAKLPSKFTRMMAKYENNPIALKD